MLDTQELTSSVAFSLFSKLPSYGHEQLVFCNDDEIGLKAIIALHNTVLGPAMGGVRMWPYASEEEAIEDALRLSRGMTYKSSLAGLNLGGGKSVIIADPSQKNEFLLRRFGAFVETLGGRYWTAEDVNMSTEDMGYINMETPYVLGIPVEMGGSDDPSPMTAYGVFIGMKAAAKRVYGSDSLQGKRVVVQGIGHVGTYLVELLLKDDAKVLAADVNEKKLQTLSKKHPKVDIIPNKEVYSTDADIFAPCALGGGLNEENIPQLKCAIVAGAANNQLQDEIDDSRRLDKQGILYAPDFMINAGGIINVYYEYKRMYNKKLALQHIEKTYQTITKVFDQAEKHQIFTHEAALQVAKERINKARKLYRSTNTQK